MSRKAPKNYGKASAAPKAVKSTVTAEEERQAKRVIGGIAIGLAVICAALVLAYYLLS